MIEIASLVAGLLLGFMVSRRLRRPQNAAAAASVARNVGANLGRRKGLAAPELQRACFSEMVRHVRVDQQGRAICPSQFLLQLHSDDLATVNETHQWFSEGLAEALRQAAKDNGWAIQGRISISYEADPKRRPGAPNALAVAPDSPKRAKPTAAPSAPPSKRRGSDGIALRRSDTGACVALRGNSVSIGRANGKDIVVNDKRVSRDHAVLQRQSAKSTWTIADNGSANGTVLNGSRLQAGRQAQVNVGDSLVIGPVTFTVESDDACVPGTRALDDRDRTRISSEVLPPRRNQR
ncbi:MAG: DUF3662 domain-containing protein [Acidimicrobiales bacterium]|nr:DUF3662 domain-containing protein [Acidimicrobiales bacterium]